MPSSMKSFRSPFIDYILHEPIPLNFNIINLLQYDGKSNLRAHLQSFCDFLLSKNLTNAHTCKFFPTSLTGGASS